MTTMPIDNHPLTQRRLQFIGIRVNKLTLKSIDIIQSSNNYSFICWNQNIVHMKILDTSFKMTKRKFRFRVLLYTYLYPRSMTPSLINKEVFPFVKLYRLVSVKTKQYRHHANITLEQNI